MCLARVVRSDEIIEMATGIEGMALAFPGGCSSAYKMLGTRIDLKGRVKRAPVDKGHFTGGYNRIVTQGMAYPENQPVQQRPAAQPGHAAESGREDAGCCCCCM
jgi:hypothetical protein